VDGSPTRSWYRGDMDRRAQNQLESRTSGAPSSAPITAWWLGRTRYRDAWDLQHRLVAARVEGSIGDQLLLLEHEPVLTLGRHSDPTHVLASPAELAARGIELIETERGGEVTYHGPGQLTAYPIIRLADRGLLVRPLVRALETALSRTCAAFGVEAGPRDGYPGCWCGGGRRKIGAIGVRIEHGVSYHGIALNVTVRLADFELIDACGLPGVESTSIGRESGRESGPQIEPVARAASAFAVAFAGALGAPLSGNLPPAVDPLVARAELEEILVARSPAALGRR
jgi:lipoyl(octanoyl) transferase